MGLEGWAERFDSSGVKCQVTHKQSPGMVVHVFRKKNLREQLKNRDAGGFKVRKLRPRFLLMPRQLFVSTRTISPPLLHPCLATKGPSCDASKFSICNQVTHMPCHNSRESDDEHAIRLELYNKNETGNNSWFCTCSRSCFAIDRNVLAIKDTRNSRAAKRY